jgi:glycosyltransferase involved in cell wall biosynthesis
VATRVGGIVDAVVDQHTGFLVPPRTPSAMASAIERLLI